MKNKSCVYLVGTGPGDPDLLTVKALRLIKQADVIVYDRLVSEPILDLIPAGSSRIFVGKATDHHTLPQDEINALLVKMAHKARTIVRLKGGDPLVFGRGSEEATFLARHDIDFEIIPGVTAATAATTYAGIPMTHRGLATGVQIITGHSRNNLDLQHDWQKLANEDTTLVVYMGLANIHYITRKLIDAGLPTDTPAAAIQDGATPRQRRLIGTLADLAEQTERQAFRPPVLFVIGKVVALAEQMDWYLPRQQASVKEDAHHVL
ncbi:uroporphyrinogen-III C-methyltransferase [Thiohalophilus sp.]|uniref:uroporphyrinogen-III C-methyltransferase n=1 Tax=Thiohalophilus sp. TaxID=3028392 RepID=UPI002ACE0768|nr:uroporphyrinogen-III C-methyltransferase [Thiohalophilus sp.]MDZ7804906.1 uroporphyrinogen-III C-methyltransferase [Thiohalophilus sp.]